MRPRSRIVAGTMAGALIVAACGGGGDDAGSGAQAGDPPPAVDSDGSGDVAADTPAAPAIEGAGFVDLIGAEVIPEADVASNLLPSVVLDDVTNGRKVNFRNLVPQDKPILLWMYAPH